MNGEADCVSVAAWWWRWCVGNCNQQLAGSMPRAPAHKERTWGSTLSFSCLVVNGRVARVSNASAAHFAGIVRSPSSRPSSSPSSLRMPAAMADAGEHSKCFCCVVRIRGAKWTHCESASEGSREDTTASPADAREIVTAASRSHATLGLSHQLLLPAAIVMPRLEVAQESSKDDECCRLVTKISIAQAGINSR